MELSPEQQKHTKAIEDITCRISTYFEGCHVVPCTSSKNYVYKLMDRDEVKCKVRAYPFEPANLPMHKDIQEHTEANIPRILDVIEYDGRLYKFVEWVDGVPLNKVTEANTFEALPDKVMYEWGKCMAKINNIKSGSEWFSIVDIWWFNFLWDGEKVVCCDMSKLHRVFYPLQDIYRWIIFNCNMKLDQKDQFMRGYFAALNELDQRVAESLKIGFSAMMEREICQHSNKHSMKK